MNIQFLAENKTMKEGILAEHGLSVYIETEEKNILFDAGASGAFSLNAERMGVDLSKVDFAVVSHGHYDHTEGFPVFCHQNKKASIYIHKNAFRLSHGFSNGEIEEEMCGIRWSESQKKIMEDRMHYTDGPIWITKNIVISGTVPYSGDFVPAERFYYYNLDGKPIEDDMSHEQCLIIRQKEGITIFAGCCHRGVLSAVDAAKGLFPEEKISLLVAGMHLYQADQSLRQKTIEELKESGVERFMPVHCTGIAALCELKAEFGEDCIIAMAGERFDGC